MEVYDAAAKAPLVQQLELGMDAGGLSTSTIARLARFAAIRRSDRVYGRDR